MIMHFVSKHGWSTHHLLWPDQAPARWKSWAEHAADENVVIQIPDCCFASRRIEKRIIGLATSVEIGSTRQLPAARRSRSIRSAHVNIIVQIPDRALSRG